MISGRIAGAIFAAALTVATAPVATSHAQLAFGLRDPEAGAAALRADQPNLAYRYAYLSGGVGTGFGWPSWTRGDGTFVSDYVADSAAHGFTPVLSLYHLAQSEPGNREPTEWRATGTNLADVATMRGWWADLELLLRRAAGSTPVILHLEPDLFGWSQQHLATREDDPSSVDAQVAATGRADLQGLPDSLVGLTQGVLRLRDALAPNVRVAYALSQWGTDVDLARAQPQPSVAVVDAVARRSALFLERLATPFDLVFAEFANQDAGREVTLFGNRSAWWSAQDFADHVRYLGLVSDRSRRPMVLWQVPVGNTSMQASDNTAGHYQDNRAEWLLGPDGERNRAQYAGAGAVAFLFGHALPDATCACDGRRDGLTNPPSRNGFVASFTEDDDGGLLRARLREQPPAGGGAPPGPPPPPGPAPSGPPVPGPSSPVLDPGPPAPAVLVPGIGPVPRGRPDVAAPARAPLGLRVDPVRPRPGARASLRVTVVPRVRAARRTLRLEIRDPAGRRVLRRTWHVRALRSGVVRSRTAGWRPRSSGRHRVRIVLGSTDAKTVVRRFSTTLVVGPARSR